MPTVPTTAGDTDVADLGVVLMHEHVFIRTEPLQLGWPGFGGWDTEAEVAAARERLGQLRQAGVGTILDMTVPGLYRDPALIARAAHGTGVNIMFATGYYTYDNLPFPCAQPNDHPDLSYVTHGSAPGLIRFVHAELQGSHPDCLIE